MLGPYVGNYDIRALIACRSIAGKKVVHSKNTTLDKYCKNKANDYLCDGNLGR